MRTRLGASLLARTFSHTHNQAYRELAQKAIQYTADYQRSDGSGTTGKMAVTGSITFILVMFSTVSSATSKAREMIALRQRWIEDMNTGRIRSSCRMELPDTTTTRLSPLTFSAVRKRLIRWYTSTIVIQKAYLLR